MSIGYPDWQRVSKRGFGQVGSVSWAEGAQETSLVMDVSLYSNILLYPSTSGNGVCLVDVEWLASGAGYTMIGLQQIPVGGGIEIQSPLVLPCQSSWVKLIGNATRAAFAGTVDVYATDRVMPVGGVPIISSQQLWLANVPADGTESVLPLSYMSGPATLSVYADSTNAQVLIQTYDTTLAVVSACRVSPNAGVWTANPIILPLGAWYARITNNSGAAQTVGALIVAGR